MNEPQVYQVTADLMPALTEAERRDFNELLRVWQKKLARNHLRNRYYNGKNRLKDLGIAIPPALTSVETVVGWPAKAVDALAVRSIFDGFTFKNEDISEILRENDFNLMYSEAVTSELINSCAFITLSEGRDDEPQILINFYSATCAAALWDVRRKRIKCGFTVADYEDRADGQCVPLQVNFYTNDAIIECVRAEETDRWAVNRIPSAMGRPLMEPLRYRPALNRPFGKSRISRAVMSITDSAVRTCLRAEVSAELYTSPQRYLLGADESTFGGYDSDIDSRAKKVEAYLGTIFAITPNENGDIPQYGQLAAMSMQPHTDYMRSLAARFAGETGIPISSLGVIHDNPASAEAMRVASEDLIIEAEALNEVNGRALENIARMIIALRDGDTFADVRATSVRAEFKNPMRPSIASQTDAVMKQANLMGWFVEESDALAITLPELGYNESQTEQLINAKESYEARQALMYALQQEEAASGSADDEHGSDLPQQQGGGVESGAAEGADDAGEV